MSFKEKKIKGEKVLSCISEEQSSGAQRAPCPAPHPSGCCASSELAAMCGQNCSLKRAKTPLCETYVVVWTEEKDTPESSMSGASNPSCPKSTEPL